MSYRIFMRTWWEFQNGQLTPTAGKQTNICNVDTEKEAQEICRRFNLQEHIVDKEQNPLSLKCEYDEEA